MTDSLHADDELLNEYLDRALAPGARAALEAHLAGCAPCRARLAAVEAVFRAVQSLPDEPLARDLSPAVLAALRARAPAAPVRSPLSLRLIFAAQAFAALILLAVAWPALQAYTGAVDFAPAAQQAARLAGRLAALVTAQWSLLAGPTERVWSAGLAAARALPEPSWYGLSWGVCLAASGLFWLLGNGVLLSPCVKRDSDKE